MECKGTPGRIPCRLFGRFPTWLQSNLIIKNLDFFINNTISLQWNIKAWFRKYFHTVCVCDQGVFGCCLDIFYSESLLIWWLSWPKRRTRFTETPVQIPVKLSDLFLLSHLFWCNNSPSFNLWSKTTSPATFNKVSIIDQSTPFSHWYIPLPTLKQYEKLSPKWKIYRPCVGKICSIRTRFSRPHPAFKCIGAWYPPTGRRGPKKLAECHWN